MGEKLPRIFLKVAISTSLLGYLTCRKFTTWDRRRAEDLFARKIGRLRPGLNPLTRVPKASTLTSRPPKPTSDIPGTIQRIKTSLMAAFIQYLHLDLTRLICPSNRLL